MNNPQPAVVNKKAIATEDWAVVLLGFMLIALALSGLVFPTPSFSWKGNSELFSKVLSQDNLLKIGLQFFIVMLTAILGGWLTGKQVKKIAIVFPVIYLLTVVALIIAGSSVMKSLNLEAVIFSLGIGLLISNTMKLPGWFSKALTSEMFVKIGLVLLGTTIIFSDILKDGGLGLLQSLIVVLCVWYFAFYACRFLKIDKEMGLMISSAVSICGVSAAIATSGAIKGDNKKLSYVISLVLIVAVPMMIFMPYLAEWMGLSQKVTGAWLGGSIDTTGAVVASGSLVGDEALKTSTIVKFSQNVLLGIAAFAISVYWTYINTQKGEKQEKPTLKIIWQRFPKFILGFVAASLLFSFALSGEQVALVKEGLKNLQGLWFALAFTSIGLETKFSELFRQDNKKPLYAFLIAQLFNVVLTLLIAWLLFS
ncbi:YeiH family protein [Haoranjiania flava]|uniref:YeiH family protein n=1 Tax=Haoranjiania flava TaxID=1856322 RepID=A0AAE3INH0_9BACT|nr:YeiH family protein [Haoranjiania flava]MCU7693556.1 YeiH family protein [Haoranjiania flava]